MTRHASYIAMLVGERESHLVMIEVRVLPGLRLVAGSAVSTQGAVVNVIFVMTINTSGGCRAIRGVRLMARGARERHVRILQGEARQVMGEAGLVQLVDICVPAEVLGMATTALTGRRLLHSSVVAGLGTDIGRYVLVTVETEGRLPLAIGSIVAVTAGTLELGVRFAERARHDELLDGGSLRGRRERRGQQHQEQRPQCRHVV
jgi:hypothetical protein